MESDFDLLDAKAILEWQAELGISEAISEKPINRFEKNADEKPSVATFNPDATSVNIKSQSPIVMDSLEKPRNVEAVSLPFDWGGQITARQVL